MTHTCEGTSPLSGIQPRWFGLRGVCIQLVIIASLCGHSQQSLANAQVLYDLPGVPVDRHHVSRGAAMPADQIQAQEKQPNFHWLNQGDQGKVPSILDEFGLNSAKFIGHTVEPYMELTFMNINPFVAQHELFIGAFYDPKCPKSQPMLQWLKEHAEREPVLPIATVNISEQSALASRFSVKRTPSIWVIFRGNTVLEYTKQRNSTEFSAWLEESLGAPFKLMTFSENGKGALVASPELAAALEKVSNHSVSIVLSTSKENPVKPLIAAFSHVANEMRGFATFVLNLHEGTSESSLYVHDKTKNEITHCDHPSCTDISKCPEEETSQDEEMIDCGELNEQIVKFIVSEVFPTIAELNHENFEIVGHDTSRDTLWVYAEKDLYKQFLDNDFSEKIKKNLKEESLRLLFVNSDLFKPNDIARLLQTRAEISAPLLAFQSATDLQIAAFNPQIMVDLEGEKALPTDHFPTLQSLTFTSSIDKLDIDILTRFAADSLAQKSPMLVRSQVPHMSSNDIEQIVGLQWNEKFITSPHNVLLMVYAPWCPHCANTYSVLSELSKDTSAYPNLKIMQIDGTKNDPPFSHMSWSHFPTIYLKLSTSPIPIKYKGNRSMDSIKSFLQQNLSQDCDEKTEGGMCKAK